MNKPNIFKSSRFHMDAQDILHILIKDLTGTGVTIALSSDTDGTETEEDSEVIGSPTTTLAPSPLMDKDGNEYTSVQIGTQEWIIENFRCTKYADGTSILNITSNYEWVNGVSTTRIDYGMLYNWYAATDARNLANTGWHVPSVAEFEVLKAYIGGFEEGGKLKEVGFTYWNAPNTNATNVMGFNGRGAGYRDTTGSFANISVITIYATTDGVGFNYILTSTSGQFAMNNLSSSGFSIRLLKNSTTLTHGQTGTYTGNDGKVYDTICIGTQEWLSENLSETKYRDGSEISHGGADPNFYTNAEWAALTTEACCVYNNATDVIDGFYCWYDNDIANKTAYGALYNWHAVNDASELAYLERDGIEETEWRVATNTDFQTLSNYLGGDAVSGGKLKEIGTTHWHAPNVGATDVFDFRGLPSGDRTYDTGSFGWLTYYNFTWASTEFDASQSYYMALLYTDANFYLANNGYKKMGLAVRLVKDV